MAAASDLPAWDAATFTVGHSAVIVGPPMSGKTVLQQHLAWELGQRRRAADGAVGAAPSPPLIDMALGFDGFDHASLSHVTPATLVHRELPTFARALRTLQTAAPLSATRWNFAVLIEDAQMDMRRADCGDVVDVVGARRALGLAVVATTQTTARGGGAGVLAAHADVVFLARSLSETERQAVYRSHVKARAPSSPGDPPTFAAFCAALDALRPWEFLVVEAGRPLARVAPPLHPEPFHVGREELRHAHAMWALVAPAPVEAAPPVEPAAVGLGMLTKPISMVREAVRGHLAPVLAAAVVDDPQAAAALRQYTDGVGLRSLFHMSYEDLIVAALTKLEKRVAAVEGARSGGASPCKRGRTSTEA
jgi:hypothetical protein